MANIPLVYNVSLVDVQKFRDFGTFANNFDDFIVSEGINPFNSMDSYFLRFANARTGNIGGNYYEDLDFTDKQIITDFI